MKPEYLAFVLLIALLLLAGYTWKQSETPQQMSVILTGHITIGPLCPVEPCQNPPNLTQFYGNMRVNFYDNNSGKKAAQATVNSSGDYYITALMQDGKYLADVTDSNGRGLGISPKPPKKEVDIAHAAVGARTVVVLDFDIDTGIR